MELKFSNDAPFFELNIHFLNPLMKDIWLQYAKYLTTLESSRNFCEALVQKYQMFYTDFYERFNEFMQELQLERDLSQIDIMMQNYDQILKVGANLGCL